MEKAAIAPRWDVVRSRWVCSIRGVGVDVMRSSALADGRAEVRVSDARGRYLVATQALGAGDIVIISQPYASVLDEAARHVRCDHRFATAEEAGVGSLLRCSKSKVARYASCEAQAAAWRSGYKEECASLVACAPRVPSPTVRLAARILWRRRREMASAPGSDMVYAEGAAANVGLGVGYDAVHALVDNWHLLSDEEKSHFAHAGGAAAAFTNAKLTGKGIGSDARDDAGKNVVVDPTTPTETVPETRPESDPRETPLQVAKLVSRLSFNCHTICDDELNPIGIGLYPNAATMNHSCVPNCCSSFKGNELIIRTLRPVEPDEELTIAYVELSATRAERRAELLKHYKFDLDEVKSVELEVDSESNQQDTQTSAPSTHPIGPDTTLHDYRADDTSVPAWRMDKVDQMHGCAVSVNGVTCRGGVLVVGPVRKTHSKHETVSDDKDARRVDVHIWGSFTNEQGVSVTDREHVGVVISEAARVLVDTEHLADVSNNPAEVFAKLDRFKGLAGGAGVTNGETNFALGTCHVLRVRARALLLRMYIQTGNFEAAVSVAKMLLPAYRRAYPKNHPPLGLHLALLAKTEAYVGSLRKSAKHGEEAVSMLRVCYGDSRVTREVEQTVREMRYELAQGDEQTSDDEDYLGI